jgi:hypothetical protein
MDKAACQQVAINFRMHQLHDTSGSSAFVAPTHNVCFHIVLSLQGSVLAVALHVGSHLNAHATDSRDNMSKLILLFTESLLTRHTISILTLDAPNHKFVASGFLVHMHHRPACHIWLKYTCICIHQFSHCTHRCRASCSQLIWSHYSACLQRKIK